MLAAQGELTPFLTEQLDINRKMSQELTAQAQRMSAITNSQAEISTSIRDARQALTTIREQAQWISSSSTLGKRSEHNSPVCLIFQRANSLIGKWLIYAFNA